MVTRNYYITSLLWVLPASSSVGLPSVIVDVGDERILVVDMVATGGVVIAVLTELLVVELGLVDCMALLVVMIGTEESTAVVVVVAAATTVDVVVVVAVAELVVAAAVGTSTVADTVAEIVSVVSMTEVVSTSVTVVATVGISVVIALGIIIKELLEESILAEAEVLGITMALVEEPILVGTAVVLELIITGIESATVESNTKEVVAVALGFSVDIKLVELILAIIVGPISEVVEEASVGNDTFVLYTGPVPHLLLAVTVIV